MNKDIEKILSNTVVPEMEYAKLKHVTVSPEVPEIVLPKTKAEMYKEAKGRLDQKTAPVSRKNGAKIKRPVISPADEALAAVMTVELDPRKRSITAEMLKKRIGKLRKVVEQPKWVGSADELVPFAWRNPLCTDIEKPSKVYRATAGVESKRGLWLPVPHRNNH